MGVQNTRRAKGVRHVQPEGQHRGAPHHHTLGRLANSPAKKKKGVDLSWLRLGRRRHTVTSLLRSGGPGPGPGRSRNLELESGVFRIKWVNFKFK